MAIMADVRTLLKVCTRLYYSACVSQEVSKCVLTKPQNATLLYAYLSFTCHSQCLKRKLTGCQLWQLERPNTLASWIIESVSVGLSSKTLEPISCQKMPVLLYFWNELVAARINQGTGVLWTPRQSPKIKTQLSNCATKLAYRLSFFRQPIRTICYSLLKKWRKVKTKNELQSLL